LEKSKNKKLPGFLAWSGAAIKIGKKKVECKTIIKSEHSMLISFIQEEERPKTRNRLGGD